MRSLLVAWIGRTDLRARTEEATVGSGPIAQALTARSFDEVYLLSDYSQEDTAPYLEWLRGRCTSRIEVLPEKLTGPTEFGEIYEAAVRSVTHALGGRGRSVSLTFHLSPGTPAMAAVWIILGKAKFPAEFIESSKEHGVRTARMPFDLTVDFLPDLLREQDQRIRELSAAAPPAAPEFADIIHRSRVMSRLVERARRVAARSVPVLIEGESGTGKELLARAIHKASPRRERPFVPVNCGAISPQLIESELFGYEKGAFTDAKASRQGYFEAANGGTLFLDELGEMPGSVQVKLLRAIQEGEVLRVGATTPIKVDVRIVAATNRVLTEEVASGRFREDLFYRLAVAALKLPPLREREGDLGLLIDHELARANSEAASELGQKDKTLSASARRLLQGHSWPGNVRELSNTLRRALIWSEGTTISVEDVQEAILSLGAPGGKGALGRPLGEGLNLPELLAEVARHYLQRAMEEAGGNKTKAAELVGLPSYQTLTNWLSKYKVET